MDIRNAEKISNLAKSLKKSGLVNSAKEAFVKAEEIILRKKIKKEEPSIKEDIPEASEKELKKVDTLFEDEKNQPQQTETAEIEETFKEVDDIISNIPQQEPQQSEEDIDVAKETKTVEDVFKDVDEEMIRTNQELEKMSKAKQDNPKLVNNAVLKDLKEEKE